MRRDRRAGDMGVDQRAPPVEAERPLERERDPSEVPLEGEDGHQEHRSVEEEQEHAEVGAETPFRPVSPSLRGPPDDAILGAGRCFHGRRHQRSSRRFENRVITNTPATKASTSKTAAAEPCGYWTAFVMYEFTIVPTDWT